MAVVDESMSGIEFSVAIVSYFRSQSLTAISGE